MEQEGLGVRSAEATNAAVECEVSTWGESKKKKKRIQRGFSHLCWISLQNHHEDKAWKETETRSRVSITLESNVQCAAR